MDYKDMLIEFNDDGQWEVSNLDYDGSDEDLEFLGKFTYRADAYEFAITRFIKIEDEDKLLVVMDRRNREMEFVCYGEADKDYLLRQLQDLDNE
ncbi:hypothetical protein ABC255_08660 [Neobacillus sp. 3P2-tot-E-2]|uniref:hypothetical protein n=1 Tax=Neobacillus sp. 3P2-tot-E-2 TaxID=3132212 RepID=UPI0039A01634